jgi:hypothetical protein
MRTTANIFIEAREFMSHTERLLNPCSYGVQLRSRRTRFETSCNFYSIRRVLSIIPDSEYIVLRVLLMNYRIQKWRRRCDELFSLCSFAVQWFAQANTKLRAVIPPYENLVPKFSLCYNVVQFRTLAVLS